MGIIEEVLSSEELSDGTQIDVEYNEGDVVHIHIGLLRLNLTKDEFQKLALAVNEGKKELEKTKNDL